MIAPTRKNVKALMNKYWHEAGCPKDTPRQAFWPKAERELTPLIILGLANELRKYGISRQPGDLFYSDFYYCRDIVIAQGNLEDNGTYIVRSSSKTTGECSTCSRCQFDLFREEDVKKLIAHLVSRKREKCTETAKN